MGSRSHATAGRGPCHLLLIAGLSVLLQACGGGTAEPTNDAVQPPATTSLSAPVAQAEQCLPSIVINEVARDTIDQAGQRTQRLRVELHNTAACAGVVPASTLRLAEFANSIPEGPWTAGEYRVMEAALPVPVAECAACVSLRLERSADGGLINAVSLPSTTMPDQFLARSPNGSGDMVLRSVEQASLGRQNPHSGPVMHLSERAGFRPRDSSANAIVRYADRYWVFGGWSNYAHDVWYSAPDVWTSADGVNWTLVNPSPPYSPYSAFLVYQNRIWAISNRSFSSSDGIEWREEPLQVGLLNRVVLFRGALVTHGANGIRSSVEGNTWTTLLFSMPWGAFRVEPHLIVHADRLWLFGGADLAPDGSFTPRNDVWVSSDGVTWTAVTQNAAWQPRRWSNAISYDDKLWIFNGLNYDLWPQEFSNVADIWYSSNGADWYPLTAGALWGARHASFMTATPDGGVLIAAGYGSGGVERMYSDVWKFKTRLYFAKPSGNLERLDSWGRNADGSGARPATFDDPHAMFVLRNRSRFELTVPFQGHSLVAGDGLSSVEVDFRAQQSERLRVYAAPGSKVQLCQDLGAALYSAPQSQVTCGP
jgi:hypothetical protein